MIESITVFDATACKLGEGGLWHRARNSFFWVDILSGEVFEKQQFGLLRRWATGCYVSALFEVRDDADRLWLVSERGLLMLSLVDGSISKIYTLPGISKGMRTNDAGVDPVGALVYGTMYCDPNRGRGGIYRLDEKGEHACLKSGVSIPNTFQWSADGSILYTADSYQSTMFSFGYDNGTLGRQSIFFAYGDDESQVPDGSTMDDAGYLWNACWGGGKLTRHCANGEVELEIKLPVSQPTSCVFDTSGNLFVTSATDGLSRSQLMREPLAGHVFRIETGYRGRECKYLRIGS